MSIVTFNITTVELSQSTLHLLNSSISYSFSYFPLQQLSSPSSEAQQYAGLLYTPTLGTKCADTMAVIPRNLTLSKLPPMTYVRVLAMFSKLTIQPFIAFAPASNCRDTYVQQATTDGAKAIILYPPSNTTFNSIPAVSLSYNAQIPVYFTDYMDSAAVAEQMNLYNTDIRDVPNGDLLSSIYPSDSYVRLAMTITRNGPPPRSLPGLWIFLLVVLGLLCLIVASTSVAMVCLAYFVHANQQAFTSIPCSKRSPQTYSDRRSRFGGSWNQETDRAKETCGLLDAAHLEE